MTKLPFEVCIPVIPKYSRRDFVLWICKSVHVTWNFPEFLHLKWDKYIFGCWKERKMKMLSAKSATNANIFCYSIDTCT